MYKIVAFEGLPASGKSTIINELRKAMSGKGQPLFIDRFMYSAMIYDLFDGRDRLEEMREFYDYFKYWGVYVIYLDVSPETSMKRMKERGPKWKKYDIDQLKKMQTLYTFYQNKFPMKIMQIVNAEHLIDVVVKECLSIIEGES